MMAATPDNSILAPHAYAEAKHFAEQMTEKCGFPRSVLACAMLRVIEELATADPAPAHVTRVCVAETAGHTYAEIARTLSFDARTRLDASVSERMA